MFGVNGWEIILLAVIAVLVLGPDKLPEYAAKLARGIRKARVMAEGAKEQLKDQLGPEYEDINWRQYDPRQYDPRRIVKEALLEPLDDAVAPVRGEIDSVRAAARSNGNGGTAPAGTTGAGVAAVGSAAAAAAGAAAAGVGPDTTEAARATVPSARSPQAFDASRPTPFDDDAT